MTTASLIRDSPRPSTGVAGTKLLCPTRQNGEEVGVELLSPSLNHVGTEKRTNPD